MEHVNDMYIVKACAYPESFIKGCPTSNFDNFFVVDEGREDPNTTISGPSSARQRNTIKWCFAGVPMMAIKWCFAGVPMMAQH